MSKALPCAEVAEILLHCPSSPWGGLPGLINFLRQSSIACNVTSSILSRFSNQRKIWLSGDLAGSTGSTHRSIRRSTSRQFDFTGFLKWRSNEDSVEFTP